MLDRRNEPRAKLTFKSAYVRARSGLHFVTLRNVSESGVCFDSYPGVAEGDEVEYCIDWAGPRNGVVRWVEGGRFGISADANAVPDSAFAAFPPRSVRLPLSFSALLFVNSRPETVTVSNLSIRGTCIGSSTALFPGQLVSLRIGNRSFEQATIRWARHGKAGIRFAEPIHPMDFRNLVERLQTSDLQPVATADRDQPVSLSRLHA